MKEFFHMSGYGAFVWSAYGIAVGSLLLNTWLARRSLTQARDEARRRIAMQENS